MKILIVTQKIDRQDAVLGFMHEWIREFAVQAEHVVAVGLGVGEYELPKNVSVESLGKEAISNFQFPIFKKLRYTVRFWYLIWKYRSEYDAVFVHMNQVYIILGAPLWKLLGKKVSLWYAHGHVPFSLRIAEQFTDLIFTSTKSGCRLVSSKIRVIGQGIDTTRFVPATLPRNEHQLFGIITVGRISPAKGVETLLDALVQLKKEGKIFQVEIVGAPALGADQAYADDMRKKVLAEGLSREVQFTGAVANKELPHLLQHADLFVNMGKTGSLDKVVPEAMAAGLPILTSNEAFLEVLGSYTDKLMYPPGDVSTLARKIEMVMGMSPAEREALGRDLREIVGRDHSLKRFVKKILAALEN